MNTVSVNVESTDDVNLDPVKKKYDKFTADLVDDMKIMGTKAGNNFGTGIAAGMEKSSNAVEKANDKQRRAFDKLMLAQQRLVEVGENAKAKESQRMAVAQAYTNALREVEEATNGVAEAEAKLVAERNAATSQDAPASIDFDVKGSIGRIKSQAIGELKSAGIMAGSAFAGGLAAGMTSVGAAGFFIGLAAMAQSSNQQIRAKFSDLWEQVKSGAQEASSELSDDFIKMAEQLGRTFNTLKPQLTEAMNASQPAVRDLTDGIDRMAKRAMPGLVTAAKASAQATGGLADMMESAGQGVANFFTESVEGAAAGGQAFASFGRIVERLGTFAGRIIADLANSSTSVFPQVEHAVNATADAVENLASTVLPSLAGGAALGLSGLTLLLQLANSLITVLGPLAPVILNVATALKLLDMISFGGVRKSWDGFTGSIKAADGPLGKTKAGLTGILTTLGPVGVGAAVLTLGLGFLAAENEKAARKEQQHRDAIKSLGSEFERTGGTVDSAIRKMVGQRIVQDFSEAKKAADGLGVGLGYLTEAALKQGPAYDDLHKRLTAIIATGKELRSDPGTGAMSEHWTEDATKAQTLLTALEALGGETNAAKSRQQELADAMSNSSGRANTLAEEFQTLADKTASATDKAEALFQIQQRMAGIAPDVEEATRNWEEFIDTFNKEGMNFEDKAAGTQKWANALLDVNGKINVTTSDGRKLYDTVTDMSKGFNETAIAMKANGDSADAIKGKLQSMRDQFIDAADKMGFTREQAIALADKYGMIPRDVSTFIHSNLSPEIQKAIDLGGRIVSLPDGNFAVHANTRTAQGMLDTFVQRNDGRVIHIRTTVSGVSTNLTGGGRQFQASGGPTRSGVAAAGGGARSGAITVNERGIETMTTPDGSTVMLGAPVGSRIHPHDGNTDLNSAGAQELLVIVQPGGASDFEQFMADWIRKFVLFKAGGNVQRAFGDN